MAEPYVHFRKNLTSERMSKSQESASGTRYAYTRVCTEDDHAVAAEAGHVRPPPRVTDGGNRDEILRGRPRASAHPASRRLCVIPPRATDGGSKDDRPATEQPAWQCGDHTAEPESADTRGHSAVGTRPNRTTCHRKAADVLVRRNRRMPGRRFRRGGALSTVPRQLLLSGGPVILIPTVRRAWWAVTHKAVLRLAGCADAHGRPRMGRGCRSAAPATTPPPECWCADSHHTARPSATHSGTQIHRKARLCVLCAVCCVLCVCVCAVRVRVAHTASLYCSLVPGD